MHCYHNVRVIFHISTSFYFSSSADSILMPFSHTILLEFCLYKISKMMYVLSALSLNICLCILEKVPRYSLPIIQETKIQYILVTNFL